MEFFAHLLRRSVPYRNLVFFRFGLAITFLWFLHDFYVINQTKFLDETFRNLIPAPTFESFCADPGWNHWLGQKFADLTYPPTFQWILLGAVPLAICFALGRIPRLSAVGISLVMVLCGASAPLFQSSADSWLFWAIFLSLWAPADPPLTIKNWRENPAVESRYVALAVFLSFTVYFFAGCSKLVLGGHQWLGGTALQNIAFDPSVREAFRGMIVPHWISLILCYYTLFQRLVVPFFFYMSRPWQIAAIVILGTMHFGYNTLMYVSIFPALGLSFLLLIPTTSPHPYPTTVSRWFWLWRIPGTTALVIMVVMPLLQVISRSSDKLSYMGHSLPRWTYAFYYPLRWEMFAYGGIRSRDDWQFLIVKNHKEVIDITHLIDRHLPPIWRTRFYHDSLDGDAYTLWSVPNMTINRTELSFQIYVFLSQNVYIAEGGPKALFITDSHIRFESGDEKIFR